MCVFVNSTLLLRRSQKNSPNKKNRSKRPKDRKVMAILSKCHCHYSPTQVMTVTFVQIDQKMQNFGQFLYATAFTTMSK